MIERHSLLQTHFARPPAAISPGQATPATLGIRPAVGSAEADSSELSFQVTRFVEPLDLSAAISADRMVVAPVGYVDMDTAPRLATALFNAVDSHPEVCCDLTGVSFFSAAGVHVLLLAHERADRVGSRFSIRHASGVTLRVLRITGVAPLLLGPE